ncbi:hypothetical protein ACWDRX_26905, partial [Streptomyces nigra]
THHPWGTATMAKKSKKQQSGGTPATVALTAAGVEASEVVARALASDPALPLAAGGGALAKEMIRVNHYGTDASAGVVRGSLAALGAALAQKGPAVDVEAALRAVDDIFAA